MHREIDFFDQYQHFKNYRAEQPPRRVTDSIFEQVDDKGNEQTIIRVDRIMHAVEGLMFRVSHMLSLPSVNFNALMSKWSFAAYNLLLFLAQMAIFTLVLGLLINIRSYLSEQQFLHIGRTFPLVVGNPIYQIIFFIMIFVHGRTVLFRLDDKEV